MKGLCIAFSFLTRLPLPQVDDFKTEVCSTSIVWFPVVGLVMGLLLAVAAWFGLHIHHWMAALLVALVWIGVTGALHLDGLADLADALGAAHRDPERFHEVIKDPHLGTFGVVALIAVLMTKLVATSVLLESQGSPLWVLVLIPVWARFGAMFWLRTLKAIAPGSGEQFAWQSLTYAIWAWALVLFIVSWMAAGFLFVISSIICLWLWRAYLKWRLNGMTGDCLGAGIEVCESCMLLLGVWFAS